MKIRVFNLIVLDASGSMWSIQKQAMDGVNETIQTIRSAQQKAENQEHFASLVVFNSDAIKTVYDCVPAMEIKELTAEDYVPNACTPLYDAIGKGISDLRKHVAESDMVLVTIVTDGYENSSKEFNRDSIGRLIEDLKQKNWVFTYMGANQDVFKVGKELHIDAVMAFEASPCGTDMLFKKESARRAKFMSSLQCCLCEEDVQYLKNKASKDYFKDDED